MRKISGTSKKGFLEKIYKNWTLPQVFRKSRSCLICGCKPVVCGHHLWGRVEAFDHIHPLRVIPVCMECHSKEKSTSLKDRRWFQDRCEKIKKVLDYASPELDKESFVNAMLEKSGYSWR